MIAHDCSNIIVLAPRLFLFLKTIHDFLQMTQRDLRAANIVTFVTDTVRQPQQMISFLTSLFPTNHSAKAMIAALSPAGSDYEETMSTLQPLSRTKRGVYMYSVGIDMTVYPLPGIQNTPLLNAQGIRVAKHGGWCCKPSPHLWATGMLEDDSSSLAPGHVRKLGTTCGSRLFNIWKATAVLSSRSRQGVLVGHLDPGS